MENKINSIVKKFRSDRIRRQRFTALMTVLSMVVSSSVFWQLRSTGNALTDEYLCGMTEHVHSAECISEELSCTEDHEHTDECAVIVMKCDETLHSHSMQCMSDISADIESAEDWEATLPETLTGNFSKDLIAVAVSQLGYRESDRNFVLDSDSVRRGYTRYGQWYGSRYGEWNTMFTYFCLYYAGITEKIMPYGSGCWAWTETLSEAGLLTAPDSGEIKVGDLVFFDTNADDRPDRSGIVSAISNPDDEEDSPQTITVIEGDLGDKVDTAEYSIGDEKLVGFVSIDKLAEAYMESQTSSPEDEEPSESDVELPMLAFEDPVIAAYANNGNSDIVVNGITNNTTADNRLDVTEGDTITVVITLHRDKDQYPSAYFEEVSKEVYDAKTEDYQKFTANDYDGITHYHITSANIYPSDNLQNVNCTYNAIDANTVTLTKVFEAAAPEEGQAYRDYTITYNSCQPGVYNEYENLYIRSKKLDSQTDSGAKLYYKQGDSQIENNTSETNYYPLEEGLNVTLIGVTDQFTSITEAEYNALSDSDKKKYVKIKNGPYVTTNAKFWSFDVDRDANGHLQNTVIVEGKTTYTIVNGKLHIEEQFTTNEVNTATKAKITFYDGTPNEVYKHYYDFYVNVTPEEKNSNAIYVYTAAGYRHKDRINEWLDIFSTDLNKKGYIPNLPSRPYIMYEGDSIHLKANGDGYFACATNGDLLTADVPKYEDGATLKTYTAKINNTQEKRDITINFIVDNNVVDTIYVRVLPHSEYFDHADIEIADGSKYRSIKKILRDDGSYQEIEEIYEAVISDVNGSKIYGRYDVDAIGNITTKPEYQLDRLPTELEDPLKYDKAEFHYNDYVNNGDEGGTQYEFTSKSYNGRIDGYKPYDNHISHVWFSQADVAMVEFDVQLTLKPESIIVREYNETGKLIDTKNEEFTGNIMVLNNVMIPMTEQSVLDAVNKCPDHSGLDFTLVGDISKVANIKAAMFTPEAQKKLENGDLKANQFKFRLTDADGKELQVKTNDADGSIAFGEIEYLVAGTYTYYIEEVIPTDDISIKYDTTKYRVVVEVTFGNNSFTATPTYYLGDSDTQVDPSAIVFKNVANAYMLPNTGGSGTTIFFILGPMLMLGSAVIAIRRKRKESV